MFDFVAGALLVPSRSESPQDTENTMEVPKLLAVLGKWAEGIYSGP